MGHSKVHPYPLPFPNDIQRTQITSYSSLANALGTEPAYTKRQGQTPRSACDAVTESRGIYLEEPPVSNPSYPYPARNVFNPRAYLARTPSSVSSRRSSSIAWDEDGDQNILLPRYLSRYDRLPQPRSVETDKPYGFQAVVELSAVHFLRKGAKEPYSLRDLLAMDTMPDLVAGDSPLFVQSPDRWIKIKLIWPGYSNYPFEKRIQIKQGAPLTPSLLQMVLAYDIEKFVRWIRNEGATVESGQERWAITGATGGTSAMWKDCVITSLQHQTGSIWQPEIYCPKR